MLNAATVELRRPAAPERPVLITGGAGFLGTHLAHRLLTAGRSVIVFDNLSRAGGEAHLRGLNTAFGERVEALIADICDAEALRAAVARSESVFHLAAVDSADPLHAFEVNVRGTLNVLAAVHAQARMVPLVLLRPARFMVICTTWNCCGMAIA